MLTWPVFFLSLVQRMVLDNQELILHRLEDIRKVYLKEKKDASFIATGVSPLLQKKNSAELLSHMAHL